MLLSIAILIVMGSVLEGAAALIIFAPLLVPVAARLGIGTLPSRTNFVCFDLGSRERAEATVEALLRLGVFVRKPAAPPLDGYVRVTVGTAPERARFADAFTRVVAG